MNLHDLITLMILPIGTSGTTTIQYMKYTSEYILKLQIHQQLGLIILRFDPVIPKGRIVLNVDVEGLIILRLDPIILKGRIVLNVDVEGLIILRLDPIILKGMIILNTDEVMELIS